MTAVTWNPSDKAAGVTLSGGDLTASHSAASYEGVRATTSNATGKLYFEVYVTGRTSPVGLLTSGGSLTAIIGSTTLGRGFFIDGAGDGNKYYNSIATVLLSGLSLPATIMVAADLDNNKVWFGVDGTWSGDPDAGTGEAFNNATQTYFPAWVSSFLDSTSSGVGRFMGSDFSYTIPSGFSAWDPTIGTTLAPAAGSSAGSSTAIAYYGEFGRTAGTSNAVAVGVQARLGVGSATGICAVEGSPELTVKVNRLTTVPGTFIYCQNGGDITSPFSPYSHFTDAHLPVLMNGNVNDASPYITDSTGWRLLVYIPGAALADQLVIYSSSLDPSDQLAYPTFAEPGDNGLIGDASSRLRVSFPPLYNSVPQENSSDPLHASGITDISGNRLTKLVLQFDTPQNIGAILINGYNEFDQSVGLDSGTIIKEIQLLSTYTVYTEDGISTAESTDTLIAVHTIKFESIADASATVVERGYAKLTDGGVATDAVIVGWTEKAAGLAAGASTATARTILQEVLVDGGVASDLVSFYRSIEIHSDGVLSTRLSGKITHTEQSTGEAADELDGEAAITQSEESTGVATDTVIGIRRVTVIEISGGVGSNADSSTAHADLTLISSGQVASVVVQRSVQTETLESSGFAEETLPSPFQGSFPVFWTNSISAGAATWEGLPFNSFIEADGVVYAAGPLGIFAMGDDLDDIGVEVPSEIEWDLVDSGSMQMKRMRSMYVNARSGSPFTVRVANEQGIFDYQTETADTETVTNHRATIGRGIVSRNARLSLLHTKVYAAEGAGVGMLESTRRI